MNDLHERLIPPAYLPTNTMPPSLARACAVAPVLSLDDLRATCHAKTLWLWDGYLAAGNVTLLTSQWKSGKTTLLSILLARLKEGGELAGQRVVPGRAVVVSEEAPENWLRRAERLDFGRDVGWMCRPFLGKPTSEQWLALVEQLAGNCTGASPLLVVIDPLASFLPGSESHARPVMEALIPLQRLAARGASVLLLHHPRKGEMPAGQAARGSGALSGFVDVLIEMTFASSAHSADRRRRLMSFSRHERTPPLRVIELNADGTDYLCRDDEPADDDTFARDWPELHRVLSDAVHKLSRPEIILRWPAGRKPPPERTLWRWLDEAAARRLVCRDGAGHKNDPFYYWLPGKLEEWEQDPLTQGYQEQVEMIRGGKRDRSTPEGSQALAGG